MALTDTSCGRKGRVGIANRGRVMSRTRWAWPEIRAAATRRWLVASVCLQLLRASVPRAPSGFSNGHETAARAITSNVSRKKKPAHTKRSRPRVSAAGLGRRERCPSAVLRADRRLLDCLSHRLVGNAKRGPPPTLPTRLRTRPPSGPASSRATRGRPAIL